ncbi:MAG: TraB/GumN family protein [Pseudomonadota bacterium]|nr:TraB/GumN family protein [Pseudomonadota bacterium]
MNVKPSTQVSAFIWDFFIALACLAGAFAAEASDSFDSGLLWKVERAGVTASYLFGTMHSDDPSVVTLPTPVQRAFDQAQSLTLEVVLDPQSLLSMTSALLMTDGNTLESLIGRRLYERTVEVMSAKGIPEMLVANMKPWAVAVTLMTPPAKNGVVLDHVLYQGAVAAGKKVHGLETVAEQMGLFDGLSLKDQITLLEDTLDNLDMMDQMLDELQAAYLDRDLKRLLELSEASMRDSDPQLAETFNRTVIVERNHRMAERMQSHLREGQQFIAVGALHLPGKDGLLNLLSERGYRLRRIY